jgi:hypothetical protein
MIYGSFRELNGTYRRLNDFLASDQIETTVFCDTEGSPEPYDKFLSYIKFTKSNAGSVSVILDSNFGVVVGGSTELLSQYIEAFNFPVGAEGHHKHPDFSISGKNNIWPFVECSD